MLEKTLKKFEKDHKVRILYVTKYGSKLYGTDNENSDTDYKGVFLPEIDSVLLKKDPDNFSVSTGKDLTKNSKEDIDIQLFSIHKFFNLIKKGETGALDLLFSMWSQSIVYQDNSFVDLMKDNYQHFLTKNVKSFTGYAISQSRKYGVKGSRYNELVILKEYLDLKTFGEEKLNIIFDDLKSFCRQNEFKFIKFVNAPGPKTGKGDNIIEYFEVLGRKFSGDVLQDYFKENVIKLSESFGNRTKQAREGHDWKAISHAVRVVLEVEELLTTGFITFPLKEVKFVKFVKEGNEDFDTVSQFLDKKLDDIERISHESSLPEKPNFKKSEEIELKLLKDQ